MVSQDIGPLELELLIEGNPVARGIPTMRIDIQSEGDLDVFVEVVANSNIAALGVVLVDGDPLELPELLWELELRGFVDERSCGFEGVGRRVNY